jgi:alanine-glyoxylate transaminase/serine-glyoxylate transaminase/serine-pyruvate transaminase
MSRPGRHFLQIPGPTNVPDRVLRAMDNPTMDHRGPDFAKLGKRALDGMKRIVKTEAGQVVIYPASGTGAWEAALVNTLSPGDKLVMFETGHFAWLWEKLARRIGLEPEVIGSDWRRAADPGAIEAALRADSSHEIKAVCVVQNETSTGSTTRVGEIRAHHLVAGLDRYANGRMGCRCHRRGQPEGADAAAGFVVQCYQSEGDGGAQDRRPAARLLGLV